MSDNSLVEIRPTSALEVFTTAEKIEAVLARVEAKARKEVVGSVDTAKGRKEIASLAYKVAQTKTYIDTVGKDLVAEMKELPKAIDASRKVFRERLDALRDELRAPLDAWEAEQERIEREKAEAKAAEEARAARIAADIAAFVAAPTAVFDKPASAIEEQIRNFELLAPELEGYGDRFEEARDSHTACMTMLRTMLEQRQKFERIEQELRDKQIAAEAEERARKASEQLVIEAKLAQERAEQAAEQARKDADAQAAKAVADEAERLARVKQSAEEAAAKRAADVEHRKKFNNEALVVLMSECGLDEHQGKATIAAIAKGLVPHIEITY